MTAERNTDIANGGAKYDTGKVRMDLLPADALMTIAAVFTYGVEKYAAWNWALGMEESRLLAAMKRHLAAYEMGEEFDDESGLPHLGHAGFCVMTLIALGLRGTLVKDGCPDTMALSRAMDQFGQMKQPPAIDIEDEDGDEIVTFLRSRSEDKPDASATVAAARDLVKGGHVRVGDIVTLMEDTTHADKGSEFEVVRAGAAYEPGAETEYEPWAETEYVPSIDTIARSITKGGMGMPAGDREYTWRDTWVSVQRPAVAPARPARELVNEGLLERGQLVTLAEDKGVYKKGTVFTVTRTEQRLDSRGSFFIAEEYLSGENEAPKPGHWSKTLFQVGAW